MFGQLLKQSHHQLARISSLLLIITHCNSVYIFFRTNFTQIFIFLLKKLDQDQQVGLGIYGSFQDLKSFFILLLGHTCPQTYNSWLKFSKTVASWFVGKLWLTKTLQRDVFPTEPSPTITTLTLLAMFCPWCFVLWPNSTANN